MHASSAAHARKYAVVELSSWQCTLAMDGVYAGMICTLTGKMHPQYLNFESEIDMVIFFCNEDSGIKRNNEQYKTFKKIKLQQDS
jgi:glutamine synthetase adenylyltransferase